MIVEKWKVSRDRWVCLGLITCQHGLWHTDGSASSLTRDLGFEPQVWWENMVGSVTPDGPCKAQFGFSLSSNVGSDTEWETKKKSFGLPPIRSIMKSYPIVIICHG